MTSRRLTALALLGLDVITAFATFNVISHVRLPFERGLVFTPLLFPVSVAMLAIYLIEGYRARTDMLSVDYTSQHVIALVSAMIATLLLTFAFIPAGYELQSSRLVIALSFLALIPITLFYRRAIYLRRLARRGERSLVFLGDRESCEAFRVECAKMGTTQRIVYSVISDESATPFAEAGQVAVRPFHAVLDDVQSGALTLEAIILRESARELTPDVSQRLVQLYFAGVPTYTLELFHDVYWRKIPLYRLNQTWLFQEGFEIAREPVFERLKRMSDIVLSIVGLALAAPLIACGALAIWIEDRGPVFFAQTRIGRNHAPFTLFKLRTMRASRADDQPYTQLQDSRITRAGRFLRTTRFDELPQLWNVLRGDMSLIGPRAEWDRLVALYENEIPCYHFRHLVKPGITGWAQVNYPYGASIEDTLRKLEYDLYYIRHFSFRLDATIVLKTIHLMLFGRGR